MCHLWDRIFTVSQRSNRFSVRRATGLGVTGLLLLAASAAGQTAPPPVLGNTTLSAGIPTGPSADKDGKFYSLEVFYFDNVGGLAKSTVTVPGIPVTAGLPNPTAAQILAARTAKAAAIVAAINAAKLNGVTATVDATDPTTYLVTGVRQSVQTYKFPKPGTPGTYLGAPVYRTAGNRVTGETGNGNFNFKKGGGPGGGGTGSMYQGTMMSVDSNIGLVASGLDYSGNPSVIGIGLVDYTGATPVSYVQNMTPTPGMTDSQILSSLASQFNTHFTSSGFTLNFDPTTNWLSFVQPLPAVDMLVTSDSDVNLDFAPNLIDVPEPASAGLLVLGAMGLLVRRRRGS